jgi:hypothetical protein
VLWRVSLLAGLGVSITAGCGGKQTSSKDGDEPGDAGETNFGTGGSGTGGSSAATGGLAPTGGTPGRPFTCTEPYKDEGGFIHCGEQWVHRPENEGSCKSRLPSGTEYAPEVPGECHTDGDCGDPLEFCVQGVLSSGTYCQRGCLTNADCTDGALCVCGTLIGACSFATCDTDADCPGSVCLGTNRSNGCGSNWEFACASPEDECWVDADCGQGQACSAQNGARRCEQLLVCGRPFLVRGSARKARVRTGSWSRPSAANPSELLQETRAALEAHWTDMALMEHASIAAFSRFLLELLSLGAPAELVRDAQRALGDEIAHAELCFALATRYSGRPIAPGALSIEGALDTKTAVEIGHTAFLEACLGEAQAVAEARAALEEATDPAVRSALARIVEDEARHAELGFRFVKWLLEALPARESAALSDAISRSLDKALRADVLPAQTELPAGAPDHGLVSERSRAHARRLALVEVCAPCVRALLDQRNDISESSANAVRAA